MNYLSFFNGIHESKIINRTRNYIVTLASIITQNMRKLITYISLMLVLSFAISCKSKSPTTSENTIVASSDITIVGIAENAKMGAIILGEDKNTYYIDRLDSWDDAYYKKKVKVSGKLKETKHKKEDLKNEKGEYAQGMIGSQLIILNAKWEFFE
ncbi:MAG: hypothetical protein ACI9J3_000718 [Parvicellaceae bacterium]|jgi:hypothetical protein